MPSCSQLQVYNNICLASDSQIKFHCNFEYDIDGSTVNFLFKRTVTAESLVFNKFDTMMQNCFCFALYISVLYVCPAFTTLFGISQNVLESCLASRI